MRKLSSYKHNPTLLEALSEYNRLLKGQYLLNCIDDASLRNHVQRTLNRGEAYHQLRRAISHVNGDRFRGNSDDEIHSQVGAIVGQADTILDHLAHFWPALRL